MKTTRLHLVHGWTYTIDNWGDFIDRLKKAGFEPIIHHVPGLTAPSEDIWTIEKYVDWLRGEIGNERAPILLGHSNGGRILLAYAQTYPGHIKQLFLIGAAGMVDKRPFLKYKKFFGRIAAKVLKRFIPDGKLRRAMYRAVGARDYGNAKPNMRETMKNMHKIDATLQPEKIDIPTTLIWGSYDKAVPLALGEELRDRLPNVVSWNVLAAGHSPQINHADEVVPIISRDVKTVSNK